MRGGNGQRKDKSREGSNCATVLRTGGGNTRAYVLPGSFTRPWKAVSGREKYREKLKWAFKDTRKLHASLNCLKSERWGKLGGTPAPDSCRLGRRSKLSCYTKFPHPHPSYSSYAKISRSGIYRREGGSVPTPSADSSHSDSPCFVSSSVSLSRRLFEHMCIIYFARYFLLPKPSSRFLKDLFSQYKQCPKGKDTKMLSPTVNCPPPIVEPVTGSPWAHFSGSRKCQNLPLHLSPGPPVKMTSLSFPYEVLPSWHCDKSPWQSVWGIY